jgi:hypothetical protein
LQSPYRRRMAIGQPISHKKKASLAGRSLNRRGPSVKKLTIEP